MEDDFLEAVNAILPHRDDGIRRLIYGQLLNSARLATEHAPSAWAVTLFKDGFRLNVGPVEAFTLRGEVVNLNLLADANDRELQGLPVSSTHYKSMPEPQWRT